MKKGKRDDSLIPLSREHHYGLMVCLRIHRGIKQHKADVDWLSQRARKASLFFDSDLKLHFKTEEEIVFPAMSSFNEATETIKQLRAEHRELERLVHEIRRTQGVQLGQLLQEFADLLESHIRKEERVLFPCYERNISPESAGEVRTQVLSSTGTALKPKHPELLE